MTIKKILLIEDDPKTEATIKEILSEYEVKVASRVELAENIVRSDPSDLVIVDYDLKEMDGIQIYKKLHLLVPHAKFIMISISNNIPLAVAATKLGVFAFLKKPIVAEQLKKSVEECFVKKEVSWEVAEIPWLRGGSRKFKEFYAKLKEGVSKFRNLVLVGEIGIDKAKIAEYIHAHSLKRNRRFKVLDMLTFRRENMEPQFWVLIQEITAEPDIETIISEEDRYGTIFLKNFEKLEMSFKQSIVNFFAERRGKVDKGFLLILDEEKGESLPEGYFVVEIPPLRERKEDLPYLLSYYLKLYSEKFNKNIKGIDPELLEYLLLYDYPGNYLELERIIEEGVLLCASEVLSLKDMFLNFEEISSLALDKAFREGKDEFNEAQKVFEKVFYQWLLSKTQNDLGAIAGFLNVSRDVLSQRLENFFY